MLANPKIKKGNNIKSFGQPIIKLGKNARLMIGNSFKMNDGNKNNFIGRDQKCILHVLNNAILKIGNNVGMSSSAIVAQDCIVIGDNVRIGGNVVIYDTDFHSIHPGNRLCKTDHDIQTAPVTIGDNVFVGGHSIILKGVTIGDNSVIGAGSVVSKSIPANQIWAGNPAKFIKELDPSSLL